MQFWVDLVKQDKKVNLSFLECYKLDLCYKVLQITVQKEPEILFEIPEI